MKVRSSLLALWLVLCATPARADDKIPVPTELPEAAALLTELQTRDAKLIVIKPKDPFNAQATGLVGDLFDSKGKPVDTAKAFLAKYGPILGIPADKKPDYTVFRDYKVPAGSDLVLLQARDKVPSLRSAIAFCFDSAGKLRSATGRYVDLSLAFMGTITGKEAVKRALEITKADLAGRTKITGDGSLRTHIATLDGMLMQIYEVTFTLGDPKYVWKVILKNNGDKHKSGWMHPGFNAQGNVYEDYPSQSPKMVELTELVESKGTKSQPLKGRFFYPESAALMHASSKTRTYNYPPRLGAEFGVDLLFYDPRFLEVNVYHHLMKARKHAVEVAGVPEVDAKNKPMLFDVWQYPDDENPMSVNNAYYSFDTRSMHFPVVNPLMIGKPPLFRTGAVDASVIYHEYGHHVENVIAIDTAKTATTPLDGDEANAIDEGYADFFAYSITKDPKVSLIFGNNETDPRTKDPMTREVGRFFTYCKLSEMKTIYQLSQVFSSACFGLIPTLNDLTLPIVTRALRSAVPRNFTTCGVQIVANVFRDTGNYDAAQNVLKSIQRYGITECAYASQQWK